MTGHLSGDSGGADATDLLAEAITAYLEELGQYRSTCLRHESTTAVWDTSTSLHLARLFPYSAEIVTLVSDAVGRLPEWHTSPVWKVDGERWADLLKSVRRQQGAASDTQQVLAMGIAWEGRPVVVCVRSLQGDRFLQVELLLPGIPLDLPELPLRVVSSGLLCHEYLIPRRLASALPPAAVPHRSALSPGEYLRRATPQNLYASQCLWLPGAEK